MKKGFTLIELLAVIVILAIIALIATPIVLNIINDTRESAKIRSAELYIDALEQAIVREKMNNLDFNPGICEIKNSVVTCEGMVEPLKVDVDGTKPSSGKITLSNGKVNKNETYMDFEKDQVSYDENGDLVLGISKEYEAIEIVRNYINALEAYGLITDGVSIDYIDNSGNVNPGTEGTKMYEEFFMSMEPVSINVSGEKPSGGQFVAENGKVVSYGYADAFYITYFTVGEYTVYFGADGNLAITTSGAPTCVASNQLTYDVGLLASKVNPYDKGVEYKCTTSFGIGPGFNEYFVLDVQGDKVKLISAVHSDQEVLFGEDEASYAYSEAFGPTYDEIYGVNNSIDLSNSPWLTIQAPYYLYKSANQSTGYYVSQTGIQQVDIASLYEVKILKYNKSQLLN